MAKDWHAEHPGAHTVGQRVADAFAAGIGSRPFIIAQAVAVGACIALKLVAWSRHGDPYPFILLNLTFTVQAAYTGPILMMAQNRQAERDRHQAQADHETNVEAEVEAEQTPAHLDRIEDQHLARILALLVVRIRPGEA